MDKDLMRMGGGTVSASQPTLRPIALIQYVNVSHVSLQTVHCASTKYRYPTKSGGGHIVPRAI